MAQLGKRAKERRRKNFVQGTFLWVSFLAIIVGTAMFFHSRPPGISETTLCPADGPKGHYVLLVDKTDPLNFTQKQAFSVVLRELVQKRLPEGFLLSVFALGEDFKSHASPLVELCNPGLGEGKSELTANLRKLRRQYEEKFMVPLINQMESLIGAIPAKESPIFEMLQLVGINAFRMHDVKGDRRLIILSDMLHNTAQFSMYKNPPDYESFVDTEYGRKTQADLHGVNVELHYLLNAPKLQTKRNLKFWEDYFNKAGARIVSVRPLEG